MKLDQIVYVGVLEDGTVMGNMECLSIHESEELVELDINFMKKYYYKTENSGIKVKHVKLLNYEREFEIDKIMIEHEIPVSFHALIKDVIKRYGRNGKISHHGDCCVYSIDDAHCSCGLLHDLAFMNPISKELYPKSNNELQTGASFFENEAGSNNKADEGIRKILNLIK